MWKAIALNGMALSAIGLVAFSIDSIAVGQFDLIERHYAVFGLGILIGSGCMLIGLIGWATRLDKTGRVRLATLAVLLPLVIMLISGFSTGGNVHGVFPLFVSAMAPVMVSGVIVAIMAAIDLA